MTEIEEVQALLSQRLSDNPTRMKDQVLELEAHFARLTTILAEANSALDTARYKEMIAQPKDMTVFQKEIALDASVVAEREHRDILEGLCKAINQRVILCQSLMKAQSQERSS